MAALVPRVPYRPFEVVSVCSDGLCASVLIEPWSQGVLHYAGVGRVPRGVRAGEDLSKSEGCVIDEPRTYQLAACRLVRCTFVLLHQISTLVEYIQAS